MLTQAIRRELFAIAKAGFALDQRGIHGAPHWARVRANGLRLAKVTGADTTVVELFALLHDCKRENDGHDPEHGQRAAGFIWGVKHLFPLGFTVEQMMALSHAIAYHSDGLTVIAGGTPLHRITVATCWDADRLDLGRVGIEPDPALLCTDAARDPAMLKWAHKRSIR